MSAGHVIHGFFGKNAPVATFQKGSYIYDETGKRYLDGSSGPCCVTIDYGNEEVLRVLREQSERLCFVYRAQFRNQPAERLAEALAGLAPGDLNWCLFVNSGSEASDMAMKLARRFWLMSGKPSKYIVISRWTSYHGSTLGALSLSGFTGRRKHMTPFLYHCPQVSPPYCYRCPHGKTYPECDLLCARELANVIMRLGPEYVSAFIAEPLTGAAGGVITPPPGYYEAIKQICEEFEVLFIVDEVLTGCGRTGRFFAIEHWEAVPDMITFGKGVTSGYAPLAGVIASDRINQVLQKDPDLALTGHTFGGNPLSAAVATKVVEYIMEHDLVHQAADKGAVLMAGLEGLRDESPLVGDVRGKGLLIGVEFVQDKVTRQPFSREHRVTEHVVSTCFENGLIVYPAANGIYGVRGDAVYISPPLTISSEEITELLGLFRKSVGQVAAALFA